MSTKDHELFQNFLKASSSLAGKTWKIQYTNDAGDDGGFCEWWTVCDDHGYYRFRAYTEEEAQFLHQVLTATSAIAGLSHSVTSEFINELGNRIKVTVEGPTSMSENILTPMEAEVLRSVLNKTLGSQEEPKLSLADKLRPTIVSWMGYNGWLREGDNWPSHIPRADRLVRWLDVEERLADIEAKTPECKEKEKPLAVTNEMVYRFLGWKIPKTFSPDCGISFDGRKDDEWNKNKPWPVGTNLFCFDEAKEMIEHILGVKKD